MSLRRINKEELRSELHLIGRIVENKLAMNGEQIEQLKLKVKFAKTTIFIYEKKPILVARMKKYKIDDVIELTGNFVAEWYPTVRNALPVINDVIRVRKIGTFKIEKI